MEEKLDFEGSANPLKSSLDPTSTNTLETPEPQPDEFSDDFEADPTIPDTIDPELIQPLKPQPREEDKVENEELDPEFEEEISDLIQTK
jgi:hypothetical protein